MSFQHLVQSFGNLFNQSPPESPAEIAARTNDTFATLLEKCVQDALKNGEGILHVKTSRSLKNANKCEAQMIPHMMSHPSLEYSMYCVRKSGGSRIVSLMFYVRKIHEDNMDIKIMAEDKTLDHDPITILG